MTSCSNNLLQVEDGEYEKDGMIYCQTCHEPKVFNLRGNLIKTACSCYDKKIKAEAEEKIRQENRVRFLKLQESSLVGERYKDASFDKTIIDEETDETFKVALKRCKDYCLNHKEIMANGYGIYIYSDNTGNGKSWLTACIVNEFVEMLYPCLLTNFAKIMNEINNTIGSREKESEYIDKLSKIPLLVIDDLGTELVTNKGEDNRMQEKIYMIINSRYNEQLPTIFTSNYTLRELIEKRGFYAKTVDRISEMSTAVIRVKGKSFRTKKKPKEIPF